MNRTEVIKKIVDGFEHNQYIDYLEKMEPWYMPNAISDIKYLLEQIDALKSAAWSAEKYLSGKAKLFSHRDKTSVIYQLNKSLEEHRLVGNVHE